MFVVVTTSVAWEHIPSRWLILISLTSAVVTTIWAWLRRLEASPKVSSAALVMRLALLLALGTLLLFSSDSSHPDRHTRKPTLYILVDTSGSMDTQDDGQISRIDRVRRTWLDPAFLNKLSNHVTARYFTFAEEVQEASLSRLHTNELRSDDSRNSYILRSVNQVLAALQDGSSPKNTSVLLISDGRDTSEDSYEQAIESARRLGIPIHTAQLGGVVPNRDLALTAEPIPPVLHPGESGVIAVRVAGLQGPMETVSVFVTHRDREERYEAISNTHGIVRVDIPVIETDPGVHTYHLRVNPVPSESSHENNQQTVYVRINEEPIRVLLIEGRPTLDMRRLARALQSDTQTELTRITRLANSRTLVTKESAESETIIPFANKEDLTRYDVIVIGGSGFEAMLPGMTEPLRDYISHEGGAVLLMDHSQPQPTSWRRLTPAITGTSRTQGDGLYTDPAWPTQIRIPTDGDLSRSGQPESKRHYQLLIKQVDQINPAATVLAWSTGPDGKQIPAVIGMPIGQGRVAEVLCSDLWRYAMLPGGHATAAEVDRLWVELIRWLGSGSAYAPTGPVRLWLSSMNQKAGEPVGISLSVRRPYSVDQLSLTLYSPDGDTELIQPKLIPGSLTRWHASFTPNKPGIYRVTVKDLKTDTVVQETRFSCFLENRESANVSANHDLMQTLADSTGGIYLPDNNPDRLVDTMVEFIETTESTQAPSRSQLPAWADGRLLTLLLVWVGCEWIIRSLGEKT